MRLPAAVSNSPPLPATYRVLFGVAPQSDVLTLVRCAQCGKVVTRASFFGHWDKCGPNGASGNGGGVGGQAEEAAVAGGGGGGRIPTFASNAGGEQAGGGQYAGGASGQYGADMNGDNKKRKHSGQTAFETTVIRRCTVSVGSLCSPVLLLSCSTEDGEDEEDSTTAKKKKQKKMSALAADIYNLIHCCCAVMWLTHHLYSSGACAQ